MLMLFGKLLFKLRCLRFQLPHAAVQRGNAFFLLGGFFSSCSLRASSASVRLRLSSSIAKFLASLLTGLGDAVLRRFSAIFETSMPWKKRFLPAAETHASLSLPRPLMPESAALPLLGLLLPESAALPLLGPLLP